MENQGHVSILRIALEQKKFSLLDEVKAKEIWTTWLPDERELLAEVLIAEGQAYVQTGKTSMDEKLLSCLDLAAQVVPMNGRIAYLVGQAFWHLYSCGNQQSALLQALSHFRRAMELFPCSGSAFHLFLKAVLAVSQFSSDKESLFKDTIKCGNLVLNTILPDADTMVLWSQVLLASAKLSGEICDYSKTLACLLEIKEKNHNSSSFWISYTDCVLSLAKKMKHSDALIQAEPLIAYAISVEPENRTAWLLFAQFYAELMCYRNFDDNLTKAEEMFSGALARGAPRIETSLYWAEMYYLTGKTRHQAQYIRIACDKLKIGLALDPHNSALNSLLGLCQVALGSQEDNLHLLRSAENLLTTVLEKEPENPLHHYRLALSQIEQGKYFCDARFFHMVLAKLKSAEAQLGASEWLYFGMGQVQLLLGESCQTGIFFRNAIQSFRLAFSLVEQYVWMRLEWAIVLMRSADFLAEKTLLAESLEQFNYILECYQSVGIPLDAELFYQHGCALDMQGDFSGDESFYDRAVQALALAQNLEPHALHIRLAFAYALSHLAESTCDPECFHKTFEHYRILSEIDPEDDVIWSEWGLAILAFIKSSVPQHSLVSYYDHYLQEAEEKFIRALKLGNQGVAYNLAGLFALMGDNQKAIEYFSKAVESGFVPSLEEILEDEWLESLRVEPSFLELLRNIDEGIPFGSDDDNEEPYWKYLDS